MEPGHNIVEAPDIRFGAALLFAWIGGFLPLESGPIWIPATVARYHQSTVAVGGIASLQLLLSATAALLIAPRLGRRNPRHALILGIMIVAATALCSLVPLSFGMFATLRVVEGFGAGLCIAVGGMLASRTASPIRTFGILQFGQIVGTIVVFSVAPRLVDRFGPAIVSAFVLVVAVVAFILLVMRRNWPIHIPIAAVRRKDPTTKGALPIACLGISLVFCAFIGVVTSAGAIGAAAGLTLGQIGVALAISTPAGAGGTIVAVLLGTRIDRVALLAFSICGALGSGFLLAFTVHSLGSLALALGSLAFSVNLAAPIMYAIVSKIRSGGGTAPAAAQAAQMLGVALGPIAGASLIVYSVPALGLIAGITAAIGVGLSAQRLMRKPSSSPLLGAGTANSMAGDMR